MIQIKNLKTQGICCFKLMMMMMMINHFMCGSKLQHFSNDTFQSYYELEKDHSMIETRCLKNVVIFIQTILSFVLSRNIMCTSKILTDLCFTKQKIKTKNGFVEAVYSVLVVKIC